MHHDIADIDQDPFAMAHAFDGNMLAPGLFEAFGQALSKRHHLPLRAAGGNEHEIGDVGFALEIDGGDIFRLAVFEQLLGKGEKLLRRRLLRLALGFVGRVVDARDGRYLFKAAPLGARIAVAEWKSSLTGRKIHAGGLISLNRRVSRITRARAKRCAASSAKALRQ